MKAVIYKKNGSSDPFIYCDTEKPVPGDREVLIRIHAVSLNAADYRLYRMGLGIPKSGIFGADFAGQVEAAGKDVHLFKPGDEVAADTSDFGFGGMAEYAAVPESAVVHKPAGISFTDAAAVPLAAITALQALRNTGRIRSGQKVLVNGASGGVGTFAVQLAKYFGAEVTGVCSTGHTDMVRSIGADHVIDYKKEDFTQSDIHYDLILAVNGYHPLSAYKRALTANGIYVMVGGTMKQIFKSLLLGPAFSAGGRKFRFLSAKSNSTDLAFVINLVNEGKIKPVIDKIYPLTEAGNAFRYIESGHAAGKVVVVVDG